MSTDLDTPPYRFYQGENVLKNASSTHYVQIQRQLTERALELLQLDMTVPKLILDVGCGTSISGQVIQETGNFYVGIDVAGEMLLQAIKAVPGTPNSLARSDAGIGIPFRAGVFDAAIGIDVIRWLFRQYEGDEPVPKRLRTFFESLHGCLQCGARAIFNFHPENADQAQMLSTIATKCGFGGGIHTDFPNSAKARVNWLVLEVGGISPDQLDEAFAAAPGCLNVEAGRRYDRKKKGFNKKEWILKKKERQRLLGKKVANDSKYTGRSRRRWI